MALKTISIDPGDHIGIIITDDNYVNGITLEGEDRNSKLWKLLNDTKPDIIVFEQFALRQKSASKLIGDKFITCEVIGVIKLYSQLNNIKPIELQPVNKEYCGFSSNPKDHHYSIINCGDDKITEHVRDAYRLYVYAKLFKINKM